MQQREEQTFKNTCWLNTESPYVQLELTAGWAACVPAPSQVSPHPPPSSLSPQPFPLPHTLHWGQPSKSNPGLLSLPGANCPTVNPTTTMPLSGER